MGRHRFTRALLGAVAGGLALFAIVGCGSVTRTAAGELSTAGSTWSAAASGSVATLRDGLDRYAEADALLVPLAGAPPLTEDDRANLQKIRTALGQRREAMDALGRTYAAFAQLAAYDARQAVADATGELVASVNTYARTVGSDTDPIGLVAGSVSATALGELASIEQARRLRAGSKLIRERLIVLRAALDKERGSYDRLSTLVARSDGEVATALWRQGVGEPGPILRRHLNEMGLTYEEEAVAKRLDAARGAAQPGSPTDPLLVGVEQAIQYRAERRVALHADVLGATLTGLDDLIARHTELEAGQPVTVQSLTQQVLTLRTFLDELARLRAIETAAVKS